MEYQPGVCNIGPTEQRKRWMMGIGSFAAAVVLVGVVFYASLPDWALLAAVFPLYGAAMGILQARSRFCVGFAALGVFNVDGTQLEVDAEEALRADRRRAIRLNANALAIGIAGTLLVYGVGRLL